MSKNGPMVAGRKVLVFPYYRGNPYLNLLYLAVRADGADVVPTVKRDAFLQAASDLRSGDVMHVHWTAEIAQNEATEDAARSAFGSFCQAVLSAKERGVRVVWTVHNRVPHETTWFELERALSQFLADQADRILVMSPATAEIVSDVFALPTQKSVTIPHPSYQGIYTPVDATTARADLGIPGDLPTALFFGQMRTYKGLGTLLEAASLAASGGTRLGLLLAGRAADSEQERILTLLPRDVLAVHHFEFVPDDEVARWFAAADIAVFPYTDILNSGSIHLAATLGVPVAIPDLPHLVEQFAEQDWVHFYRADEGPADLARLLSDVRAIRDRPNSARDFALRTSPYAVSEQYADLVASLEAAVTSP